MAFPMSNPGHFSEAFSQWFRCEERIDTADHETLNAMDFAIEEYKEDAFGTRKLSPIGLEILSCLPDKTAYLQGQGREILKNPIFGLNQH